MKLSLFNKNHLKLIVSLILVLAVFGFLPCANSYAQDETPPGPVYHVKQGDTTWGISQRFHVNLNDLLTINHMTSNSILKVGDVLVIPGYEDLRGELDTIEIQFGDTLHSLQQRYQVSKANLAKLNHLVTDRAIFPGNTLIVPVEHLNDDDNIKNNFEMIVEKGESLLEVAIKTGVDPWQLKTWNDERTTDRILSGDVLVALGKDRDQADFDGWEAIALKIKQNHLVQGKTMTILAKTSIPLQEISGWFNESKLYFWKYKKKSYVSLQGIHAMLPPGIYPLDLRIQTKAGTEIDFSQFMFVEDGHYPYDPPLHVSSETIDPLTNKKENKKWDSLFTDRTTKHWQGKFQSPVVDYLSDCWPSTFGDRRSYNNGPYIYYHTGLDFCGQVGDDIYAPAEGVVVFTGETIIRGNATVIDHGWGVFSAYLHQSKILVNTGDVVKPGQLIGKVGATGRVTGPHLHWEIWVNGIRVDPMDWLNESFP